MPARIGASLSGIERILLNRLAEANAAATLNNLRLATGSRINAPSDDPSGFFALSMFQARLSNVRSALGNVTSASSIVGQVQTTLAQIRTQLSTIRTKALEDADGSLTADERAANQAAIDEAVAEITRLAETDIGERRLLDGSADFSMSGINNAQVRRLRVYSLGPNESKAISGTVTVAAQQAELTFTENGTIDDDATFTLTGNRGEAEITVTTGETLETVAARVNAKSYLTGVTAAVDGNDLNLTSIAFGSDAEVTIEVTDGTFAVTGDGGDGTANGIDAEATINGRAVTGVGNTFEINDNRFRATLDIASGYSGAISTITVSGDALSFQLSTEIGRSVTLALPGLQATRLGGLSGTLDQLVTGGVASGLNTNAALALRIVDEAIGSLELIDGSVEGFADSTIGASSALLRSFETALEDSIDSIAGIDEDEEEALLAKNQALASNAISGLAILDQQRSSIVTLIQQIAGLN